MAALILGILVFAVVHAVPCFPAMRERLVEGLGEGIYKAAFSVLAAGGIGMVVWGMSQAAFVALWAPPSWGRHVTWLLLALAFVSLVAAYFPSNIRRFTAHPMLWGVVLWAIGHLFANGDLAALILFGGFSLYSLAAMACANRRGTRPTTKRYPVVRDLIGAAIGIGVYLLVMRLHGWLFGVPVV